jgi:ubiquinone/menaquinone biosynthesis C-methylase UbiE
LPNTRLRAAARTASGAENPMNEEGRSAGSLGEYPTQSVGRTAKRSHSTMLENSWGNEERAKSYSVLEFPNTYYLAYRDLPAIISGHTEGKNALDFGCGTGRSARFLKSLGFNVVGMDISRDMLGRARELDPEGNYQLVRNGEYDRLGKNHYDLITSIFTFDNIPGWDLRELILSKLRGLLKKTGTMILLDSTAELYTNEWASFTTKEFYENRKARTGDIVRVIMLDVEDKRPVEDIFWTEKDYQTLFRKTGLRAEKIYKPLGKTSEPYPWKMETEIAPWIIFVLEKME